MSGRVVKPQYPTLPKHETPFLTGRTGRDLFCEVFGCIGAEIAFGRRHNLRDTCSGAPHSPQNASPISLGAWHATQISANGAPQPAQNFRPSRFSALHAWHFIGHTS